MLTANIQRQTLKEWIRGKEKKNDTAQILKRSLSSGRATRERRETNPAAHLRIKFREEVNKSAMKKTCSVFDAGQISPTFRREHENSARENHRRRIKRTTGLAVPPQPEPPPARVNSRGAATMLRGRRRRRKRKEKKKKDRRD